ncbi:MAG: hypothetical protein AAFY15_05745, partial [Cyanobacteria bacterium J06648_11]
AQAVRGITDSTQQTEQLTLTTQSRSEAMEQLSNQLMERIQFFQLPTSPASDADGTGETADVVAVEPAIAAEK